ncbi:hypothetical protein AB0B66_32435 [Catellatospora sp. NPDC049111]|uniref:hypothetical protein n=1 Tax=Catellatospora sp. NPDC049111 TaxID=3155271 RepID=UPI0033CDE967
MNLDDLLPSGRQQIISIWIRGGQSGVYGRQGVGDRPIWAECATCGDGACVPGWAKRGGEVGGGRGEAVGVRAVHIDVFVADGLPYAVPAAALSLAVPFDDALADRKLVALRAQATQTSGLVSLLGEQTMRDWCATEGFVDAGSASPPSPALDRRWPITSKKRVSDSMS